jgi:hypothetical protein
MGILSNGAGIYFRAVPLILALGVAHAQGPAAPPRPACSQTGEGPGACRWNLENGLGPGTRVVLSDATGGHTQGKKFLREALDRLSRQYGFTLTRIDSLNGITEAELSDAKVLIFSNGDGDLGRSIPSTAVRARVEDFVMQRGWGILAAHAASLEGPGRVEITGLEPGLYFAQAQGEGSGFMEKVLLP